MDMTKTTERHPHTASFLQTFHSGIGSNGRNYREEVAAVREDVRTDGQVRFMESLIGQLAALDSEVGQKARVYTDGMTGHGKWTPGREGNASVWIDRMLVKLAALKADAATQEVGDPIQVADGRYAVEEDSTLKFFKVKNGRKPGYVFLDIQASDDWHPIRNITRIRKILDLIGQDAHAAMVRYGRELGTCGRCGRTLTDDESRAAGIGPVCAGK